MRELTRSNDLVWISWITAFLGDAGIESLVLDGHMSNFSGSVVAIERRVMVLDADHARAEQLMAEARLDAAAGEGERKRDDRDG